MVRSDPNSDQNNEKASEGLLKPYGSIEEKKGFLKLIKVIHKSKEDF